MRWKFSWRCTLVATLGFLWQLGFAAPHVFYQGRTAFKLTSDEVSQLEDVACRTPYQVGAASMAVWNDSAAGAIRSRDDFTVQVICESHRRFIGAPANFNIACTHRESAWRCKPSSENLQFKEAGHTILLTTLSVELETAHKIIHGLLLQGLLNKQKINRNGESCTVEPAKTPEWYYVYCGGRRLVVSTYCLQSACPRIIEGEEPPYPPIICSG